MREIFANVLVTKNRLYHKCTRQEGTKCVRPTLNVRDLACLLTATVRRNKSQIKDKGEVKAVTVNTRGETITLVSRNDTYHDTCQTIRYVSRLYVS